MEIHQLYYSNYESRGRYFRASSLGKNPTIEDEIETYLSSIGDPDRLRQEEWLFCQLSNKNYLYTRFLPKGTEKDSYRRAQIYYCLLISQKDFDNLRRFPFLLNRIHLSERLPDEYNIESLKVDLGQIDMNCFFQEINTLQREMIFEILCSIIRKIHIKMRFTEERHKLIQNAIFCLPYFYRQNISFSTYYHSLSHSTPPFLICIDFNSDVDSYTNTYDTNGTLPFYDELISFLNNPNCDTYNTLFNYSNDSSSKSSLYRPSLLREDKKKGEKLTPQPNNNISPQNELYKKQPSDHVIEKQPQKIKNIVICFFVLLIFLIFMNNYISFHKEYNQCISLEEASVSDRNPDMIYDAYLNISNKYRIFSMFTNCNYKIEKYQKLAYTSTFVEEKIKSINSCKERLKFYHYYLLKFPKAPYQIKSDIEYWTKHDTECADWEDIESDSYLLLSHNNYKYLFDKINYFLKKYSNGDYKMKALAKKQKILAAWDCYEYKQIEEAYKLNSFQKALTLGENYLKSDIFSHFKNSVNTFLNWIKSLSKEKSYLIHVVTKWDTIETNKNLSNRVKSYYDENKQRYKLILTVNDNGKEEKKDIMISGKSGHIQDIVNLRWKLGQSINLYIYDYDQGENYNYDWEDKKKWEKRLNNGMIGISNISFSDKCFISQTEELTISISINTEDIKGFVFKDCE